MKPWPASLQALLDQLPDHQALRIVLDTDGEGEWSVEIFYTKRFAFTRPDQPKTLWEVTQVPPARPEEPSV